jgi:hypothetical protein
VSGLAVGHWRSARPVDQIVLSLSARGLTNGDPDDHVDGFVPDLAVADLDQGSADTSYRSDSWAISSGCGVCPHRVAISRIVSEGSLLKRTHRFEETLKPRWTDELEHDRVDVSGVHIACTTPRGLNRSLANVPLNMPPRVSPAALGNRLSSAYQSLLGPVPDSA